MRTTLLLVIALCSWTGSAAAFQGPQASDRIDPGAFFRKRCASCHTVPDPGLRTDRAWLDQVWRTA